MARKLADQKPDTAMEVGEDAKVQSSPKASAKVIVLKAFHDKDNWAKVYRPGDDILHLDKKRIEHLIKIGYAK